MKKLVILSLAVMLSCFSLSARADECGIGGQGENSCDKFSLDYEEENSGTKLISSVMQVAGSWIEVPLAISSYTKEYDLLTGLLLGIPIGVVLTARDCLEGALNTTLFMIPPYDIKPRGSTHLIKKLDDEIEKNLW